MGVTFSTLDVTFSSLIHWLSDFLLLLQKREFCQPNSNHVVMRKMITKTLKRVSNHAGWTLVALMALMTLGACNKKGEVSVDKLSKTISESVIAEQRDSGRVLVVDTIFLNPTSDNNYIGELRGHVNDSVEVVYDLTVTDEGDDLSAEWTQR